MRVGPGDARIEIYKLNAGLKFDVRLAVRDVAVSAGFVPQPGDSGSLDSYHDESGRMIYYCGNGSLGSSDPRIIYWRDADRKDEALRNVTHPVDGEIRVAELKAILAKSRMP
jgi:hypothetical protein